MRNGSSKTGCQPTVPRCRIKLSGLVIPLLVLGLVACESLDDLLDVDQPGVVEATDAEVPALAATLTRSAQAAFECAFPRHVEIMGVWDGTFSQGRTGRWGLVSSRSSGFSFYNGHCSGDAGSANFPHWAPLQTARFQGKRAAELLEGFPDDEVSNKQALLGWSRIYEGYSILLLSEAYCAVAFDSGPLQTRGEGFTLAEERFTLALGHAASVSDPAEADEIQNAALIGRARARLQLGDGPGVVDDASQVTQGYIFYSLHDATPITRVNIVYDAIGPEQNELTVGPKYRTLQDLDGVYDPRLSIQETTRLSLAGGLTIWDTTLLESDSSPLPIGTWREAQLMIAEVQGGQAAVDIINNLRATYSLPTFSSTDPVEIDAQVREERMRETFLQGVHIGDLLRWGGPWPTGQDERGNVIDDANTCMHVPFLEILGNPNFDAAPTTPS